jgi:hypothetical protein
MTARRRESNLSRADFRTSGQQHVSSMSLCGLKNDVLASLDLASRKQTDLIAKILNVLEHHHGIRADGHCRARHNLPYGSRR